MIISNNQIRNLLRTYNKDIGISKTNIVPGVKSKTASKDELAISGESRIKQRAFQAARQADDIRQDRVDDLREQISTGTYTVSDDEVAEKMIGRAIVDQLV